MTARSSCPIDAPSRVIQGFSRDPAELFAQASCAIGQTMVQRGGDAGAPSSRVPQPVWYRNVRLLARPDALYYAVAVDWHAGMFCAFDDASDALNGVCDMPQELPAARAPEHADVYVRETFGFLLRGHSLFHPRCRCTPPRYKALGIAMPEASSRTAPPCDLGTDGQPRSIRAIERELGVRSLRDTVRAGGVVLPLLEALVRFGGLTHDRRRDTLSSPVCCVPAQIRSGGDVERAARVLWPRPYVFPIQSFDTITRSSLEAELQGLIARCEVRVVNARMPGALAVFWNAPYKHLEIGGGGDGCCDDVRAMWHESDRKK